MRIVFDGAVVFLPEVLRTIRGSAANCIAIFRCHRGIVMGVNEGLQAIESLCGGDDPVPHVTVVAVVLAGVLDAEYFLGWLADQDYADVSDDAESLAVKAGVSLVSHLSETDPVPITR